MLRLFALASCVAPAREQRLARVSAARRMRWYSVCMRALYRASRGRSEAYLPSYVSVTRMAPVLCCCYLVECHMMCSKICIKNEYSLISICLKSGDEGELTRAAPGLGMNTLELS